MDHIRASEEETFLLSSTAEDSLRLVRSEPSPTKSVRTIIESIEKQPDHTHTTIDNSDSSQSETFLLSATTDGSPRAFEPTENFHDSGIPIPLPPKSSLIMDTGEKVVDTSTVHTELMNGEIEEDTPPTSGEKDRLESPIRVDATSTRPWIMSRPVSRGKLIQIPASRLSAFVADDYLEKAKSKPDRVLGAQFADRVSGTTLRTLGDLEAGVLEYDPSPGADSRYMGLKELAHQAQVGEDPSFESTDSMAGNPRSVDSFSAIKKVNMPPQIDTKTPSSRFSRQSIARTPYPFPSKPRTRKPSMFPTNSRDSILTLILSPPSSNNNTNPPPTRIARLVVPARNEFSPTADTPIKSKHFLSLDFDDEKLFRAMQREYARLSGGTLKVWISARGLRSLVPVSYSARPPPLMANTAVMASPAEAQCRMSVNRSSLSQGGIVTGAASTGGIRKVEQTRLWQIYRRPSLGHGHSGAGTGDSEEDISIPGIGDKAALEFIEGWHVLRLVSAVTIVLIASLIALLLWVFLGVEGTAGALAGEFDMGGQVGSWDGGGMRGGFRGAGGRVETGAVLGGFVLILGWTIIGVWLAISWLVV
ncbi:MAG: hypothetical protein M1827_007249 [Pycnora praestabilis]|nr:MAG: hypothetical protein M1827_007249 [Pycnora praestabilis]